MLNKLFCVLIGLQHSVFGSIAYTKPAYRPGKGDFHTVKGADPRFPNPFPVVFSTNTTKGTIGDDVLFFFFFPTLPTRTSRIKVERLTGDEWDRLS